jgi:hypothetical protein
MKKMYFVVALAIAFAANVSAQSYTETFDSNSLEWTERAYKNEQGNAIIENGVMTVSSKTKVDLVALMGSGALNTYATAFETHCYAPLDVQKPFTITSQVTVKNGEEVGLMFNFKDFGNYYAFVMTDDYVKFLRFENNLMVGSVTQGIRWKKPLNKKIAQTRAIKSNGTTLEFVVNDEPIMKVRYMPLQYTGFGYYTVGTCQLVIDEVTFNQGL